VKGGAEDGIPDECQPTLFHRGDANGDGLVDVTDGICILLTLFLSGGCPGPSGGGSVESCLDAAPVERPIASSLSSLCTKGLRSEQFHRSHYLIRIDGLDELS
jgi:hypothetical protein